MPPKDAHIAFDEVSVRSGVEDKSFFSYPVQVDRRQIYLGPRANFVWRWKQVERVEFTRDSMMTIQTSSHMIACQGPLQRSNWRSFSEFVQKRWRKELEIRTTDESAVAARSTASNVKPPPARKPRQRGAYGRRGRSTSSRPVSSYSSHVDMATEYNRFSSDDEGPVTKKGLEVKGKSAINYDDDDVMDVPVEYEAPAANGRKKKNTRRNAVIEDDTSSEDDTVVEDPGLTTPAPDQRVVTPRVVSSIQHSLDAEVATKEEKPLSHLMTNFFAPKISHPAKSPQLHKAPSVAKTPEVPTTPQRSPMNRSQNSDWLSRRPRSGRTALASPSFHHEPKEDENVDSPDVSDRISPFVLSSRHAKPQEAMSTSQQRRRFFPLGKGRSQQDSLARFRAKSSSTADAALDEPRSPKAFRISTPLRTHTPPPQRRLWQTQKKPPIPLSPPACPWRGLRNLGNTCYCNASLQMLLSVPNFVSALASSKGGALTTSLSSVFAQLNRINEGIAADPRAFKSAVDKATHRFLGYEQRDAHEFLSDLIDRVHDELEERAIRDSEEGGSKENHPNENESFQSSKETETKDSGKSTKYLPTDFFRLDVEVCLECDSCGYSRTMKEMYRHLSLDMGDEEVMASEGADKPTRWSIEKGLTKFFRPEKREVKCEKCKEGKTATQTLRILECPKVLLLHLKRFKVVEMPTIRPLPDDTEDATHECKENEGPVRKKAAAIEMTVRKNKAPVKIEQDLSLGDFVVANKDKNTLPVSPQYRLVSVAKHIGSNAFSGHYTADSMRAQSPSSQEEVDTMKWISCDDGRTHLNCEEKVLNDPRSQKNAYMLLYAAG